MFRWKKQKAPTRAELIDRKHQLEGQINVLAAELKRLSARNEPVDNLESRLDQLRNRHHQTRLQIDRTGPSTKPDPGG
jgi:hypothetical protein